MIIGLTYCLTHMKQLTGLNTDLQLQEIKKMIKKNTDYDNQLVCRACKIPFVTHIIFWNINCYEIQICKFFNNNNINYKYNNDCNNQNNNIDLDLITDTMILCNKCIQI